MFDRRIRLLAADVGVGVGGGLVADQHRVTLAVIASPHSLGADLHQPAVAIAGVAGTDALTHNRGSGARTHMHHLGAGVGLLSVVGESHRIELPDRIGALEHTTGVLPGDRRARFHLGPADLAALAAALAALGHEVVDTTHAILIAGVPILYGGVFDRGIIEGHQLHHRGVQLVGVKHRRRAALQIAHQSSFLSHDQGALELARVAGVDAEVGGQFHRACHTLGNEHKRAVAEHSRVEGSKVIVVTGNHGTQITLNQIGILLHRLTD